MKLLAIGAMVFVSFVCTGCNTVEGFGKDVKHAGKSIEKAAN